MTPDEIKQALTACVVGKTFTGPDTLFGSATLQAVFDASLPDGRLVIGEAMLAESSDSVSITGVGQGPFATMAVTATFTPSGDDDVAVVVTGRSTGGWDFASAFPSLKDSPLGSLIVPRGASLVLTTIPPDGATGALVFDGAVNVAGGLSQVAKLVGSVASLTFGGPITYASGTPAFVLKAPVAAPFTLGPLHQLGFTALLTAGSAAATIALETTIAIDLAGGQVTLPASLNVTGNGPVDLVITAPSASAVSIENLLPWALGGNLHALLPPPDQFDPTGALTLQSLAFTIDPTVPKLNEATFELATGKTWNFDSKVAVSGIGMTLKVDASSGQPQPSGTIDGVIAIGNQGNICTLDASAALPDGTFSGSLDAASRTPNVAALAGYFIGDAGLPEIDLSALAFSATPKTRTYSLSASFTSTWSLQIGAHGLAITGASIQLGNDGDGITGQVQGTLVLDSNNQFEATYTLPGSFSISAQIPTIALSTVVAALCKPLDVSPHGFDFTLTDSSVLLQKTKDEFKLLLGTQLASYGSAAFVVQDNAGWGYAFGIDLALGKLDQLPALSVLKLIDDAFGLTEILLIVGSVTDSGFSFPALSEFDNPAIKSKAITSPAWTSGVVAGLNIYALMNPAESKALGALCKLVDFSGTFAATLWVPTDPSTSQLSVALAGSINSNMALAGAKLVAKLNAGNLTLGLQATIPTTIAEQKLTFTVEADFEANGLFISGSTPDSITFVVVSLGALAIELGVDDEGIPSIGVAGSIKVADFDSSIAIFFNSQNPAQSLLAGSISDVDLLEVIEPIAGLARQSVPPQVQDLLKLFALKGTARFSIDGALSSALKDRDGAALIKAFAEANPPVILNSDPRNISILSGGSETSWSLTDLASLTHYHLAKSGDTITVTREAQVKFVPQTTQIGNLPPVAMGYAMSGELDVYGITGIVDIDIEPKTGLSIEASLSPIKLAGGKLLSVTDDRDAGKGPFLSLCSYTKNGRPPHAVAHGKIDLLGLVGASVDITISPSGAAFELASNAPVYSYDIKGAITGPTTMNAGGTASVGLNRMLNLGPLGSVTIDTHVGGSITAALNGSDASAGFSGNFTFQSQGFSVGPVKLDIDGASLKNLAETVAAAASTAITNWLTANLDPSRWLNWVNSAVIPSVKQNAQQVGAVLGGVFKQGADNIASETRNVLNYPADATATALHAANVGADDAIRAMTQAGYLAKDAVSAVESIFKGVHIDIGLHLDTPGGPHVDTATPPHGDTAPHADTPAGPHVDAHGDTSHFGIHVDTGHGDSAVPPHVDTRPHIDTPAGPHTDGAVPPHGDVGHVDVRT
ncbi:hypothetical protein ACQR16_04120 [Bradyrhizobium oligotrophicum]|uniref:hypothetical protein n=1 Tax=Bradyrhizobium oligotrophicum TaxID=44255 RepID=UPI003EBC8801